MLKIEQHEAPVSAAMSPDMASRRANANMNTLVELVYVDGTTVAGYSKGSKMMPPLISLVGVQDSISEETTAHMPPGRIHRLSPLHDN